MPRARRPGPSLPSFHPAAGTWAAAGNRFTKLRVVPPVPLSRYSNKISGVPLTGGQAQGTIPPTSSGSGTVSSPPGNFLIASMPAPGAGTWTVSWSAGLSGTLSGNDANNMQLWLNHGGIFTLLATAVNPAAAGTYPQAPVKVTAAAGDLIQVYSSFVVNPTAGAVYSALMSVLNPLTLSAGPQGLGTVWYPAQVTLSTTTGALDTSTALVYLGTGGVPTMQVASVFSGNGTAALAVPPMQPGELIIVTWANGHGGDTAAFNILGTMDALTTGRGS